MPKRDDWLECLLTHDEAADALRAAKGRGECSRAAGRTDRKVFADGRAIDAVGAIAERAWCKLTGFPWDGRLLSAPDLGRLRGGWDVCGVHVRATSVWGGSLLCYDKDPDDGPFVLAYVRITAVTFVGWVCGLEAKLRAKTTLPGGPPRPPVYRVFPRELRPVREVLPRTGLAWLASPCMLPLHPSTAMEYLSLPRRP